jgi:hypothetical protein
MFAHALRIREQLMGDEKSRDDTRKQPAPGYAPDQPDSRAKKPKAPGEGRPDEPQNDPAQKPDREN